MSYKIPDQDFTVDPAGSVPTITLNSNMSATHYHVQVQTATGWEMVVDDTGLGKAVPIKGGSIRSAADFAGKKFMWDVTLVAPTATDTVEAVLQVKIDQDGRNLLTVNDDHNITDVEQYYEYLNAH